MGQNLCIEIRKNGVALASAYYKWSAYAKESIDLSSVVLDAVMDTESEKADVLRAVRILESTGAGMACEERAYIKELYPEEDFAEESGAGRIAVTEKGKEDMAGFSEGFVGIDIETRLVEYDVFADECPDAYRWRQEGTDMERYEDLPEISMDALPDCGELYTYERFHRMCAVIEDALESGEGTVRVGKSGNVLSIQQV